MSSSNRRAAAIRRRVPDTARLARERSGRARRDRCPDRKTPGKERGHCPRPAIRSLAASVPPSCVWRKGPISLSRGPGNVDSHILRGNHAASLASWPPAEAADPPWMKTPPERFPVGLQPTDLIRGESRDPPICRRALEGWAPAFAGAAFLGYRVPEPSCFLLGWINIGSNLWDTPADERKARRAAAGGYSGRRCRRVLAADGADEEGTLAALKALR